MSEPRPYTLTPEGLARIRETARRTIKRQWADPAFREAYRARRSDPLQAGFSAAQRAAFRTLVNHGIGRQDARERILARARKRSAA